MIKHNVLQGSLAWLTLRAGIPTASQFHKIVTPTGKLSEQSRGYLHRLVAEHIMGEPIVDDDTQFMERGTELEEDARRFYEMRHDVEIEEVGFITTDDGKAGYSPDGLVVGAKRAIELKCPAPATHVGYLLDGPGTKYKCQTQGGLWIAELDAIDFVSYHNLIPPIVTRIERDEPFIALLAAAVREFNERLEAAKEQAEKLGYAPAEVLL